MATLGGMTNLGTPQRRSVAAPLSVAIGGVVLIPLTLLVLAATGALPPAALLFGVPLAGLWGAVGAIPVVRRLREQPPPDSMA